MSVKTILRILWLLNVLLAVLLFIPLEGLPPLFQFVGRLHPLILHFPIGLLVAALLLEVLVSRGKREFKSAANLLLWLGAYTATISAIAGYLLAANGDYAGDGFTFHKWFGLATSIVAVLLIDLQQRIKSALLPLYTLLVILLIITGHFGASLTHGEDFLTEVFDAPQSMTLDPQQPVFAQVVNPILESKCISCHNPNKIKGGLLLDTEENILKGGENGVVLTAGDIENSKLIGHMLLPMEDDLHMPPNGKSQPTNEEIDLLSWWVRSGASFTEPVANVSPDDPIQAVFASYFAPEAPIDIDFAAPELLATLENAGIKVKPISPDLPYLEVYMGQEKELTDDDLSSLKKIREQIHTLDLGGSHIDRSVLKAVARFKNLHRLYLDNTGTNDAMISAIRKLKKLQYLNLYNTKVSAEGAATMAKLPNLQQLYLWQTSVSPEELLVLKNDFPEIEIDGGLPEDSDFTKAELAPPTLDYVSTFFEDKTTVGVSYNLANTDLFYRFGDGEMTALADKEIELTESGKLSVFARKEGWEDSPLTEQVFIKVQQNDDQKARLTHDPKGSYKAKGVATIFNLKKGSDNFRDGEWLGFQNDLLVDVEFKSSREVKSVFISTLDDIGSWIFPPTQLEVWGGNSPGDLKKLQELRLTIPEGPEPKKMAIHELNFDSTEVKYIRIRAKHYGNLPKWHPGKDTPAWLFIDEIAFQ